MTPMSLENYLLVGAALFILGMVGFLTRRNLILMILSAELMLQGVALNLVAFSRFWGHMGGQVLTLFLLTVAACEAGLALALILMLYRRSKSLHASLWQELREPGQDPIDDDDTVEPAPPVEPMPQLPVAGPQPLQSREKESSHV